jgi:diguanylate cyclase (GGDEF)-like protein
LRARLEEISLLQEKLSEQAIRDGLTGLYNRRYLDETLPRDLARAKREGYSLAVVMLDLDHFKNVNDTYGHAGGDEVLKAIAKVLSEGARESDVVCRYGGEEFLVALPRMSVAQALERVAVWRNTVNTTPVRHGEFAIGVRFSAGIAAYPEHGGEAYALIARADQALYQSKANGRNCTTVFQALE